MTDPESASLVERVPRRRLLQLGAVGVVSGLAGCGSDESGQPAAESPTPDPDDGDQNPSASEAADRSHSDSQTLTGRIVDVHGNPVGDVTVELYRTAPREQFAATTTDSGGQFGFDDFSLGAETDAVLLVAKNGAGADSDGSLSAGDWFHTRLYGSGTQQQFTLTDGDLGTIPLDRELFVPPSAVEDDTGNPLGMVTFWRYVGNEFQQRYQGLDSPTRQRFHIEVTNTNRGADPGPGGNETGIEAITGEAYDLSSGLFSLTVPEDDVFVDYGSQDDLSMEPSLEVTGVETASPTVDSQPIERWHPGKTGLPAADVLPAIDAERFQRLSTTDANAIDRVEEGQGRIFSAIPMVGSFYDLVDTIDWAIGDSFTRSAELVTTSGEIDPNTQDTVELAWKSDTSSITRDEAAVVCTVPVEFQYDGEKTSTFVAQSEWNYETDNTDPEGNGLFRWEVARGPHGHIGGETVSNSKQENTATSGEVVMEITTDSEVLSSPTVSGSSLYVGSTDNHLYAIDTETNTEQWRFRTDGEVYSSPTVDSGTVYVGSGLGREPGDTSLYAIDADSGEQKWRFETGDKVKASPVVHENTVYVPSRDGFLYAVAAQSGEEQWRARVGFTAESSPSISDGRIYVGSFDGRLYAFSVETGEELWRVETDDLVRSSPTYADGTVYVGSSDSDLYAVDAETGRIEWQFSTEPTEFGVQSSPTVAGSTVYVGAYDSKLYAVDAATGRKEWAFPTGERILSSPTVVDGRVYVGSHDGHLYAVDRETGEQIWRVPTDEAVFSSPTAVSGKIYFGSNDGSIYGVSLGIDGQSEGSRNRLRTLGHHDRS